MLPRTWPNAGSSNARWPIRLFDLRRRPIPRIRLPVGFLDQGLDVALLDRLRTYDPGRVQLSADYAALVFALDVHRRIPGVDHNRRLLLGRILRARIPTTGFPMPPRRRRSDLRSLPPAMRQAITDRLVEILPAMRGLDEPEASQAIEDLESRLGRGLQVPLLRSGSRTAVRVEEGFVQLAVLACDWCRFDREKARKEIWDGPFAGAARKDAGGEDSATPGVRRAAPAWSRSPPPRRRRRSGATDDEPRARRSRYPVPSSTMRLKQRLTSEARAARAESADSDIEAGSDRSAGVCQGSEGPPAAVPTRRGGRGASPSPDVPVNEAAGRRRSRRWSLP